MNEMRICARCNKEYPYNPTKKAQKYCDECKGIVYYEIVRTAQKKYYNTPKGSATIREAVSRYHKSERGQLAIKRSNARRDERRRLAKQLTQPTQPINTLSFNTINHIRGDKNKNVPDEFNNI